ncbi:WD40 repeat-like protein [Martensiomyces pterosporus]|nr:WD40 repeat-like protein [Martensiomyces pterosporus]
MSPDVPLSPRKEICNYISAYPVYSLAWSRREDRNSMFRMALSSFLEEPANKVQVVQLSPHHDPSQTPDRSDFGVVAEASVEYPLTKVLWQPAKGGYSQADLLAGTGDCLRIWDCEQTGEVTEMGLYRSNLRLRAKLSTRADYAAPITSFDWNQVDPRLVIASSIDTTCTVWDIETQQAKTQLIAHDREVFDVAFVAGSQDVFASAGADGSIRMFDLRSLEHSTILYEAPPTIAPSSSDLNLGDASYYSENPSVPSARVASFTPPLLRLSCNAIDPNYIATFALDSHHVSILDVRNPGSAVMQLVSHHAPVNAIAWSPSSPNQLCSAGADSRVLVWDIQQALATRQHQQRQAVVAAAQAKQLSRLTTGKDDFGDEHQSPLSPSSATSMQASNAIQAVAQAAAAQALAQQPTPVAPCLTYAARLPVNSLAWHQNSADWVSIGFGNTVQTLRL